MLRTDDSELAESWLDGALARFAADNDDLVLQTRSLLARIVADAPRHARLANTLSMLEHFGSHKIMTTQHAADIDQPTLKHVAEEAGHAYFMKRQAEKTAQRPLEYVARRPARAGRGADVLPAARGGARAHARERSAARARCTCTCR